MPCIRKVGGGGRVSDGISSGGTGSIPLPLRFGAGGKKDNAAAAAAAAAASAAARVVAGLPPIPQPNRRDGDQDREAARRAVDGELRREGGLSVGPGRPGQRTLAGGPGWVGPERRGCCGH